MNTARTPLLGFDAPLTLAPGAVARVAGDAAAWLVVSHGGVWVTRAGDPGDHFLVAGERLRVEAGSAVLLETEPRLAPGAAVIELQARQPESTPPRRWRLRAV